MNAVQRIARNATAPLIAQLLNKAMDFAFALVMLRILGATGAGGYEFAVLVWLYTKTLSDFGLGTLTTRDVAREPERASEYLGMTTLLRLALWAIALPAVLIFALINWRWLGSSGSSTVALLLLLGSIVPDAWSDSVNAICNARERMVGPAILTVTKNLIKTVLGLGLLALGWGAVGLALTALLTNILTAGLFTRLLRDLDLHATWRLPGAADRRLLVEAWPLLLNNLLAGLFFSVDAFVLKPARGEAELGIYRAPYKYLNLLLLIPQYSTLALFPHLARLAAAHDDALARTYALAVKLLVALALPLAVASFVVAPDLIAILAGPDFLPGGAIALRLLIWFLPMSYVNGLTQYVLIAAGLQRAITPAFFVTFVFNLGANLIFTPRYGFLAAAIITVVSELVLGIPFLWFLRHRVDLAPPVRLVWQPIVASLCMAGAIALVVRLLRLATAAPLTSALIPWIAVIAGALIYLAVLMITRGIGSTERRLALRLLGRVT